MSCTKRCAHFRNKFYLRRHILGHSKVSLIQRCLSSGVSFKSDSTVFGAIMRMRGHKPKGV